MFFVRVFSSVLSISFFICPFSISWSCHFHSCFLLLHVMILSLPFIFFEFSWHRSQKKATARFQQWFCIVNGRAFYVGWCPFHLVEISGERMQFWTYQEGILNSTPKNEQHENTLIRWTVSLKSEVIIIREKRNRSNSLKLLLFGSYSLSALFLYFRGISNFSVPNLECSFGSFGMQNESVYIYIFMRI